MSENKAVKAMKSKLAGYDSLFGDDESISDVTEIDISNLHDFSNHPFKEQTGEKFNDLVDSIKEQGVLVPILVRPLKGSKDQYEIIAGHTRRRAAEIAGLKTIPAIIKDMTDEEAAIAMVDSNIQREGMLPSEKAKAYKIKFDAISHQGKKGGNSLEEIGEAAGESAKTVQRALKLATLSDSILDLVDEKKIGTTQALDLTDLSKEDQNRVAANIEERGRKLTSAQAADIKSFSAEGKLTQQNLSMILDKKKEKERKIVIPAKIIDKYFQKEIPDSMIVRTIENLLEENLNK